MPDSNSLFGSLTSSLGRSRSMPTAGSMTPNTGTRVTNVGGTPIGRPMGSVNTNTNLLNESSILSNNNLQNRQMLGKFDGSMMQMSGKLDKMSSSIVGAINRQTALISQIGGGITNALSQLPNAIGSSVGQYMSQALEQFSSNFNQLFSERAELAAERQKEMEGKFFATVEEYQEHFFSTFYRKQVSEFKKMWGELPTFKDLGNKIIESVVTSKGLRKFFGLDESGPGPDKTAAVFTQDYKDSVKSMADMAVTFYAYQTHASEEMVESLNLIKSSHINNVTELRDMMELFVRNNPETKSVIDSVEKQQKLIEELSRKAGRSRQLATTVAPQANEAEFFENLASILQSRQIVNPKDSSKIVGFENLGDLFTGSGYQLGQLESYLKTYVKNQPAKTKRDSDLKELLKTWSNTHQNSGLTEQDIQGLITASESTKLRAQDISAVFPQLANLRSNTTTNLTYADELAQWSRKYNIMHRRLVGKPLDKLKQFISGTGSQIKLQPGVGAEELISGLISTYQKQNEKVTNKKKLKGLTKEQIAQVFPNADDNFVKSFNSILAKYKTSDPKDVGFIESVVGSMSHSIGGNNVKKAVSRFKDVQSTLDTLNGNLSADRKQREELRKALVEDTEATKENTEEKGSGPLGILKMFGMTLLSPAAWMKTILPLGLKIFKYWGLWNIGNTVLDWGRTGLNYARTTAVGQFAYNSMWIPAKVHVIDPLLSGIGSIMERVIGTERMNYIKESLGKLADITKTAWTALFGFTPDARANARSKIVTPIVEAMTSFFNYTVVPFITKLAFVYFTGKKILGGISSIFKAGPGNYWAKTKEVAGNAFGALMTPFSTIGQGIKDFGGKSFKQGLANVSPAAFKVAGANIADAWATGGTNVFSKGWAALKQLPSIGATLVTGLKGLLGPLATIGKGILGIATGWGGVLLVVQALSWFNKKIYGKDVDGKKNFKFYVNKMISVVGDFFLGIGKTILGFFKPSNLFSAGKVFIGSIFGIFGGIVKGIGSTMLTIVKEGFGVVPIISFLSEEFGNLITYLWNKIKFWEDTAGEKHIKQMAKEEYGKYNELKTEYTKGLDENAILSVVGNDREKFKIVRKFLYENTGSGNTVTDSLVSLAMLAPTELEQLLSADKVNFAKGKGGLTKTLGRLKDIEQNYNGWFYDSDLLNELQKNNKVLKGLSENFNNLSDKEANIVLPVISKLVGSVAFQKMSSQIRGMGTNEELNAFREEIGESEFMKLVARGQATLMAAFKEFREKHFKEVDKENKELQEINGKLAEIEQEQEEERKKRWDTFFSFGGANASLGGIIDYMQSDDFLKVMGEIGDKIGSTINKVFKFFKDQNWGAMIGSVTQSLGALTGGLIGGLFGKEDASKFFVKAKKIADDAGLKLMSKFFQSGNDSILGKLESLDENVKSIKEKGTAQDLNGNDVANGNKGTPGGSNGSAGGGNGPINLGGNMNAFKMDLEGLDMSNLTSGWVSSVESKYSGSTVKVLLPKDYNKNSYSRRGAGDTSGLFLSKALFNSDYNKLSSAFGYRELKLNGVKKQDFHGGIDFGVPEGTPVYSLVGGKVIRAASNVSGFGNLIEVLGSNGFIYQYGHLKGFNVSAGDVVEQGTLLGQSGSTGRGTGAHLHFGIKDKSGALIDPNIVVEVLKKTMVRNAHKPVNGDINVDAITDARTKETYLNQKNHFDHFTKKYSNVSSALAVAVMQQESHGDVNAHNKSGAHGLFQLMEGTARGLGVDRNNVGENIGGGIKYLHQQIERFGDVELALMAYNWGPGYVQAWVNNKKRLPFQVKMSDGSYRTITKIPEETQNYVRDIMARAKKYVKPKATDDQVVKEIERGAGKPLEDKYTTANNVLQIEGSKDTGAAPIAGAPQLSISNTNMPAISVIEPGNDLASLAGVQGSNLSISSNVSPLTGTAGGEISLNVPFTKMEEEYPTLSKWPGAIRFLGKTPSIVQKGKQWLTGLKDAALPYVEKGLSSLGEIRKQKDNREIVAALAKLFYQAIPGKIYSVFNKEDSVLGHLAEFLPGLKGTNIVKEAISSSAKSEGKAEESKAEKIAEALGVNKTNANLDKLVEIVEKIFGSIEDGNSLVKTLGGMQMVNMVNSNTFQTGLSNFRRNDIGRDHTASLDSEEVTRSSMESCSR